MVDEYIFRFNIPYDNKKIYPPTLKLYEPPMQFGQEYTAKTRLNFPQNRDSGSAYYKSLLPVKRDNTKI